MKVITAVVNNVDFIIIQYHTLKKFFMVDYEFIVFNDAKGFADFTNSGDATIRNQIKSLCKSLNIQCINIPNEHHRQNKVASQRTADSMNYIRDYQIRNPDKYLFLDSDMFVIDYFDPEKYEKYDCAIVLQSRENFNYFWNGFYYFNMFRMKDTNLLNWDCCTNCDTGGMMQKWLQMNEKNPVYFMKHLSSCNWDATDLPENLRRCTSLINFLETDIRNVNGKYFCEIYEDIFLHYRAGGNWREEGMDMHRFLAQKLKEILTY